MHFQISSEVLTALSILSSFHSLDFLFWNLLTSFREDCDVEDDKRLWWLPQMKYCFDMKKKRVKVWVLQVYELRADERWEKKEVLQEITVQDWVSNDERVSSESNDRTLYFPLRQENTRRREKTERKRRMPTEEEDGSIPSGLQFVSCSFITCLMFSLHSFYP